ncbi:hypothetical protein AB0J42_15760 [Nonomuraea sp. NPDC049649]|uniref:hypothetical protein n=1 Tax=Nonomuraea sp. NPDC049649 TaxID=3155776 RepID=UPI003430CB53
MGTQHGRVIPLEGDERGLLAQPFTQSRLDTDAARAEALGQVAQERNPGAIAAQGRHPSRELRLSGRSTDHHIREAPVAADGLDDRHRRLRVTGQEKQGRRAALGDLVAKVREGVCHRRERASPWGRLR